MADWDQIRKHKFAPDKPPADWPTGVQPISIDGVSLFGVHQTTGEVYWDGHRLETTTRLGTFERIIALLVAASTISMAVFDAIRFFTESGATPPVP